MAYNTAKSEKYERVNNSNQVITAEELQLELDTYRRVANAEQYEGTSIIKVTYEGTGHIYYIDENGNLKASTGVIITTGNITFLKGDSVTSQTVTAKLLNNETGTIKWRRTGNITLSDTTGETITVTLDANANIRTTPTITAQIEGKDYKDSILVKVVTKATDLTLKPVTVSVGEKLNIRNITVNPENAEEIENISYISEDTSIATVDENGEITGAKAGSTTITVTGYGKLSGTEVSGTCTVTVE